MADHDSASIVTLHQPRPVRAKTPAERAKAYRERKKANLPAVLEKEGARRFEPPASTPVTLLPPENVTFSPAPSRRQAAPILLTIAALALALVGMIMNGWFARSLGSTETSGWLFLAIGVAADLVALVIPSCAAGLWQARQRATALAGWGVWLLTFTFAISASVGFAAINISDVTTSRSSRVTPAVTVAQTALSDAMSARDRECRGGVGKNCRQREDEVQLPRQKVEAAMHGVEQTADPQTQAAIRVVAWVSLGTLRPTENDFSMLRLLLLSLLPQLGGVLLMIGRLAPARPTGDH
jgi:hypothetical protein